MQLGQGQNFRLVTILPWWMSAILDFSVITAFPVMKHLPSDSGELSHDNTQRHGISTTELVCFIL